MQRTNLPLQLTSFVGRTSEVAEVTRLLSTTRLLTLTGPGGIGKTRLALEVAAQLFPHFADGVFLVDLAPLAETHLVAHEIAEALGIQQEADRPLLDVLGEVLQDQQLLLVLDNCEHLVLACAEVAFALLRHCSGLTLLATSREALGVGGELLWRVPSLPVPPAHSSDPQGQTPSEADEQIRLYEAVRLFLERAQAVRPEFRLTLSNTAAIAQICQWLDGIPLAIELAAARVQVLSPEQIAARLADRFGLLTGGSRLALPRQQTLRATLDWSYGLLTETEQTLLRHLSVFAGGWTLEAAEAVCSCVELRELEVLDGLTHLVNKSLVLIEEHAESVRFRLLNTVCQYGREKLVAASEEELARNAHLGYMLSFVQAAEPRLYGAEQLLWIQRLKREHDNLRVAFGWALESRAFERGLQLAAGLWQFWDLSSQNTQGYTWLEEILARTEHLGLSAARAKALLVCGDLAALQGNIALAHRCLQESLVLWQALGDQQGVGLVHHALGTAAAFERELPTARTELEQSISILERLGDHSGLARVQVVLAVVLSLLGEMEAARSLAEQNVARARADGDLPSLGRNLNTLGELSVEEGDDTRAAQYYEEALQCFQRLDMAGRAAMVLINLSERAYKRGNVPRSLSLGLEALDLMLRRQGNHIHAHGTLIHVASLVLAKSEPVLAARLYGMAEAFREHHGVRFEPEDTVIYERDLAALQTQLDEVTCGRAWTEGRQLSPAQTIALVESFHSSLQNTSNTLGTVPASTTSQTSQTYPAELTAREIEVLRLLAEGLTNKQIAAHLVLSPKTVGRHVESIFSKTGVNSRAAATRFAIEQQLI